MTLDTPPQRNLPDRAVPWGRSVDDRLRALDKDLTQVTQKTDNGLRASSGQLAQMARQLEEITSTHDFLINQVTTDSRDSSTPVTRDPAVVNEEVLFPFDEEIDAIVRLQVPSSGLLRIDGSASLYAYAQPTSTHWTRSFVRMGIHVSSETVPTFNVPQTPELRVTASVGSGTLDFRMPISTFGVVALPPGEECVVFTRRQFIFSAAAGISGGIQSASVGDLGLAVTKIR